MIFLIIEGSKLFCVKKVNLKMLFLIGKNFKEVREREGERIKFV